MIRQLASLYLPGYPKVLVYMLQSSEYRRKTVLAMGWPHQRFYRRGNAAAYAGADQTGAFVTAGTPARHVITSHCGLLLIYAGIWHDVTGGWAFGAALIISYPFSGPTW